MKQPYVPPRQGWVGQVFDSLFILALVYVSLLAPLLLNQQSEAATQTEAALAQMSQAQVSQSQAQPSWESLQQNSVMQAQWIKLGYDEEKAAALIKHKFDYNIDPLALAVTALVIIAYFVFLLRVSRKQFQQVINEKFDQ